MSEIKPRQKDSLRTIQLKAEAIKQMRSGNLRLSNIAHAIGVHPDTMTDWMAKDSEYSEKLLKAKMEYRAELVEGVKKRNKDFLLRTQFKDEFAEKQEIEHSGAIKFIPILGGETVSTNNSNEQDPKALEAN